MEVMPATLDLGVRPRGNAGPVERVAAETDRHLAQRRERVAPKRGKLRREVVNRQGSLEPCIVAHGEEYLERLPSVVKQGATRRSAERGSQAPHIVTCDAAEPAQEVAWALYVPGSQPQREVAKWGKRKTATAETWSKDIVEMSSRAEPAGCIPDLCERGGRWHRSTHHVATCGEKPVEERLHPVVTRWSSRGRAGPRGAPEEPSEGSSGGHHGSDSLGWSVTNTG